MMKERIRRYLILIMGVVVGFTNFTKAFGDIYDVKENKKISVTISKSGINRISNPPYKIKQIVGDDSKYTIKSDDDGSNIYILPQNKLVDSFEITIKNNIGQIFDLELKPVLGKSKIIILRNQDLALSKEKKQEDIAHMLSAMKELVTDKFYVQDIKKRFFKIGKLRAEQIKLYRWQDLKGGVFVIRNKGKQSASIEFLEFINQFENVEAYFINKHDLAPGESTNLLIVQQRNSR